MFSIVIPVYNKLPHLDRAVQSVLNQTYRNFEVIIIDDGSDDGSKEKIQAFKDSRIRLLYRESPGPGGYAARNLGIKSALYDWICFLDADDAWDVRYLEVLQQKIMAHPQTEIVSSGWLEVDRESTRDRTLDSTTGDDIAFSLKDYLNFPPYMWTGAVAIQKDVLVKAGLFPEGSACKNGGDVDTWIRCLKISCRNMYVAKPLAFYYRDSVNRVTDYGKNRNNIFCAYKTLKDILHQSRDEALNRSIRRFSNKHIYYIAFRHLLHANEIDYKILAQMYGGVFKYKVYVKLHMERIKRMFSHES